MKQTAIIYCRKSTDREDRQTNSLEHQLNNCRKTVSNNDLAILDEIVESISAKTGGKRAGFNRMIEECKKGRVDFIIIDETKRLSRNIPDTGTVLDLLETGKLKGIYTTDKKFLANDISGKFLLWMELGLSKMDNEYRSKDVKVKMITALNRGQWLGKAIFGYRNVGRKGKKDVAVIEEEATLVMMAFIMRSQNKTLQEVADFINEKTGTKWNSERVSKMLKNTKYYGLQVFGGNEAILSSPGYKPIVSQELFEKVNGVIRVNEYQKGGKNNLPRYFADILKDTEGNKLYSYETKNRIYYHEGSKTKYRINISQEWLLNEVEKLIENYNFPKSFIALSKAVLKEYYQDKVNNQETDLRRITIDLKQVEDRLSTLWNKYLDTEIDKKTYDIEKNRLEEQKSMQEEKLNAIKQGGNNIKKVIEDLCEQVEDLSGSYKRGDDKKKGKIIRSMQCELILNNKKELTIKENKLFETIRLFNFQHWYSHGELNPSSSLEKAMS